MAKPGTLQPKHICGPGSNYNHNRYRNNGHNWHHVCVCVSVDADKRQVFDQRAAGIGSLNKNALPTRRRQTHQKT